MSNSTNAAIIPASTEPTPPAGDGIRFAAMPTKKPCTSTPNGTSPPYASKLAHRIPMFAAQNPRAPTTAAKPALRVANVGDRGPDAGGEGGGPGGYPLGEARPR